MTPSDNWTLAIKKKFDSSKIIYQPNKPAAKNYYNGSNHTSISLSSRFKDMSFKSKKWYKSLIMPTFTSNRKKHKWCRRSNSKKRKFEHSDRKTNSSIHSTYRTKPKSQKWFRPIPNRYKISNNNSKNSGTSPQSVRTQPVCFETSPCLAIWRPLLQESSILLRR